MSAATIDSLPSRMVTPRRLFSAPFGELNVGDEFATQGRTISETDVVGWSAWTGDTLPVHTDRHWAEQHGLYGRRVANGLLVVSYTLGLLPLDSNYVVALRRIRDVVFKRPVFLGDSVHAVGRIRDLRELGPFGSVVTQVDSCNQDGQVVMRGTFEMLWRLSPLTGEAGE